MIVGKLSVAPSWRVVVHNWNFATTGYVRRENRDLTTTLPTQLEAFEYAAWLTAAEDDTVARVVDMNGVPVASFVEGGCVWLTSADLAPCVPPGGGDVWGSQG